MPSIHARIATRMSWIAALAAICLAGCAQDPEVFCGDDMAPIEGLDIHLDGADTAETYEIDVVADGTAFELTYAGGQRDQVETDLGDGRRMFGFVDQSPRPDVPVDGSILSIIVDVIGEESGFGPDQASVTVTMQGETVTEELMPTYQGTRVTEQCPGWWHAFETITVPTP